MGITTLLSMTVFLMLVTESMPPTSDVLPLVGQYIADPAAYSGHVTRQIHLIVSHGEFVTPLRYP